MAGKRKSTWEVPPTASAPQSFAPQESSPPKPKAAWELDEYPTPTSPVDPKKFPAIIERFLYEIAQGHPEYTAAQRAGALLEDISEFANIDDAASKLFTRRWEQAFQVGVDRIEMALHSVGVDGYEEYYTCKDGIATLVETDGWGNRKTYAPTVRKHSTEALKFLMTHRRAEVFRKAPAKAEGDEDAAPKQLEFFTGSNIDAEPPTQPGPPDPIP